ncbi:acyltransferase, partial [Vibrio xuii]
VKKYLDQTLSSTTKGVTYSGLDKLNKDTAYLFVSNHRDIAMDPALVNYGLYQGNHKTVRIAIGDNVLKKPCATELMRLNKSFIVKRSAKGPREMMKALG